MIQKNRFCIHIVTTTLTYWFCVKFNQQHSLSKTITHIATYYHRIFSTIGVFHDIMHTFVCRKYSKESYHKYDLTFVRHKHSNYESYFKDFVLFTASIEDVECEQRDLIQLLCDTRSQRSCEGERDVGV